jgi:hypothetical protein
MPTTAEILATLQTQKELRETQERLQLIIDHIDTITDVNNFKQMTAQNKQEIITKLKDLSHTLENLRPSESVVNMPGYGDLNETRRKLQTVIGVLLNSLDQLHPTIAVKVEQEPQTITMPAKKVSFSQVFSELDRGSAFGNHHLLGDASFARKQILGLSGGRETKSTVVETVHGNAGKSPQVTPASSTPNVVKPDLFGSKVPNSPSLLLQLQIRNQGAPLEGCQSWQVTAHPAHLAEAVERLIVQGLRKGCQSHSGETQQNSPPQKPYCTTSPDVPLSMNSTKGDAIVSTGKEHAAEADKASLREDSSGSKVTDVCGGSNPVSTASPGRCGGSTCVLNSFRTPSSPVVADNHSLANGSPTTAYAGFSAVIAGEIAGLKNGGNQGGGNLGEGFPTQDSICAITTHTARCSEATFSSSLIEYLCTNTIPLDAFLLYMVALLLSTAPVALLWYLSLTTTTTSSSLRSI